MPGIADVLDLSFCTAHGPTPHDAVAEVELAAEACLEAAREAGRPIPEPRSAPPAPDRPARICAHNRQSRRMRGHDFVLLERVEHRAVRDAAQDSAVSEGGLVARRHAVRLTRMVDLAA